MTCAVDFNSFGDVFGCIAATGFQNDMIIVGAVLLVMIMIFMFKARFGLASAVAAGLGITFAFTAQWGGIWAAFFYIIIAVIAVSIVTGWIQRAEK